MKKRILVGLMLIAVIFTVGWGDGAWDSVRKLLNSANTWAQDQIFSGDVSVGGDLAVTGNATMGTTGTVPTLYGSSAANGDLTLEGTASATKATSYVILQPTSGNVGINNIAPSYTLDVTGTANASNLRTAGEIVMTGKGGVDRTVASGVRLYTATGDVYLNPATDLKIRPGITTGALTVAAAEATANITAAASVTIAVNVPAGSKIIGCQLRVDTALTTGETWDAAYAGGATQAIASAQAVAKSTKVNKFFDANAATDITSGVTTIAITKNGGGSFTAAGAIRAIVYYQYFAAMADAP